MPTKKIKNYFLGGFFLTILIVGLFFYCFNFYKKISFIPETFQEKIQEFISPQVKPALANYQFNPIGGNLIVGSTTSIDSVSAASAEGRNTGSWKGTLADDNFHWIVQPLSSGSPNLDVQLDIGAVQLHGANTFIVQTEFDTDNAALTTLIQICDWVTDTGVDAATDTQCTGGGWRTLNVRKIPITGNLTPVIHYQIYDGYFINSENTTTIDTPLTNFVNASNTIRIRYWSDGDTATDFAIDYLRVYAVINPVYSVGEFVNVSEGAASGTYANTVIWYASVGVAAGTGQSDNIRFDVYGTEASSSEFYFKFKNVKTYPTMNTVVVLAESSCSANTYDMRYKFRIRNFNTSQWEDISNYVECYSTEVTDYFAKNNVLISDYINTSNEMWIGALANQATSSTSIRLDQIYIQLGTTNTDENDCEVSFGSQTVGRVVENPSGHLSDAVNEMILDSDYMYLVGYDSIGYDYEWRIEKRWASSGELVTAFDSDGIVTIDPSIYSEQALYIATSGDGYIFIAGFDGASGDATNPFRWRLEKRSMSDGSLDTAFDDDGVVLVNPTADNDYLNAIAVDDTFVYLAGFEDDDNGVWRIEKRYVASGSLDINFGTAGVVQSNPVPSGDERPQTIKVDDNYIYIAGYESVRGGDWRVEKRNKTTGALCDGIGNCAADAFDGDGVATSSPSTGADKIYAMKTDTDYIYLAGLDYAAGTGQWRIEKRWAASGSLDVAFDADGIIQLDLKSDDYDWVTDIDLDSTYLYVAGFRDDDAGTWYMQKRNKTTGVLDTNFSNDGTAQSEDGGNDRPNAISVDSNYIYISGFGTGAGDNQWLMEKRDIVSGLRVSSGFGGNPSCSGTRDIDTTSGDRSAWAIQSENESSDMSHDFYAMDNDYDGNVEEASAANIGFNVQPASGTAITSIFFAGRAMSGSAGTVRFANKDYSGFTGTIGGLVLVGGNLTQAMAYTNNTLVVGVASGAMAGYINNPEDFVDTTNYKMRLHLNTTVAGASTTNSVAIWDFAMVSLQWIETETTTTGVSNSVPVVSSVSLNGGTNINLIENATTSVVATGTVTDNNGYADISSVVGRIFRSGATSSESCTLDDNNCYEDSSCSLSSCSGNDCVATCEYNVWFHAEPTDIGSDWATDTWVTWIKATDDSNASSSATNSSQTVDMNTLTALNLSFSWYDSDWLYRKKITINHTKVDDNLTDFPILISTTSNDFASKAQSDCDDILFTQSDGKTKIPHEIEYYASSTGQLVAWVKTNLSSTTDTELYIYYGNSAASNQQETTSVWDDNYIGVYHLNEPSGIIYDSTQYSNNGTTSGGTTYETTGQIATALEFSGGTGKIDLGNPSEFDNAIITVESWINTDHNYTADGRIVTIGTGATNLWALSINATVPSNYAIMTNTTASHATARTNSTVNNGAWHYIVGIRNPESIYMNGDLQSSTLTDSWSFDANAKIGTRGTSHYFYGIIDEVRISNINRSAAWISTSYNTMNSPYTFMTFGNEENLGTEESGINGINYGILYPGEGTSILNKLINVVTTGNQAISAFLSGSDMCTDYPTCSASTIAIGQQHYSTDSISYALGFIASTTGQLLQFNTSKPIIHPSDQNQNIYWGISVPAVQEIGIYNGQNSFIATSSGQ